MTGKRRRRAKIAGRRTRGRAAEGERLRKCSAGVCTLSLEVLLVQILLVFPSSFHYSMNILRLYWAAVSASSMERRDEGKRMGAGRGEGGGDAERC